MADLTIRRFESGDGPAVLNLHETALRDAGDFVEGVPEPDLDDVVGHYLAPAGAEFLVATLGDAIVGMVAYHPVEEWPLADEASFEEAAAELTRMRVAPAHQREGIGRTIYGELERRARADGYEGFVLDVSADNGAGRAFYEALGFECRKTTTLDVPEGTFRLAIYRKGIESRAN